MDSRKAEKIGCVEGEQVHDSMALHGSDKSGIVAVLPFYVIVPDQPMPVAKDASLITQQPECLHPLVDGLISRRHGHSEAVILRGARDNHPIFIENLRHQDSGHPLSVQGFDRSQSVPMLGASRIPQPQDDVGIQQNGQASRPA